MAEMSEAQRKRAEARQKRRDNSAAEPADDAGANSATEGTGADEQPLEAVKQAAKVAAAGAAVGAAAAAARALTSHRDDDGAEAPEADEEEEQAEPPRDEQSPQEPEEQPNEEDAEQEPAPEAREQREREPEREAEQEEPEPVEGVSLGDAKATIDNAREELEELLGRPVEEVSSFERTHDGWVVSLEVVELERVPESTDVLASYELELDENRNLRRYHQVRRYHRAQAERRGET